MIHIYNEPILDYAPELEPDVIIEPELDVIEPVEIVYEPILDYQPLPEPIVVVEPTYYNETSIVELAAVAKEASEEPITHDSSSAYGYGALTLGVAAAAVYLYKRRQDAKASTEEEYMR